MKMQNPFKKAFLQLFFMMRAFQFLRWLKGLKGKDRKIALDFMFARFREISSVQVMHISQIGNIIARNMFIDLLNMLNGVENLTARDMNLNDTERGNVFLAITFHVRSAVQLGRRVRMLEKKERRRNCNLQEEWGLKRDRLYFEYIMQQK